MKFHNIEQNSDEWYQLRGGKITSSKLSCIMANFGKAFGEPAKKYAINIAVEQITGKSFSSDYSNDHMQRGHEEEPLARSAYENQFFCKVDNGGFFDLGEIGCSPDGLVGDNGVIEIKSAVPSVHYSRIIKGSFDAAYKWQLVGNLKYTGRDCIDFISYCSSFPIEKQLYVYRCHKDDFEKEFVMLDERVDEFKKMIADTKEQILNSNYMVL